MAAKKDCLTAVLCDRVMAAHSATAACAAVSELCRKRDDFLIALFKFGYRGVSNGMLTGALAAGTSSGSSFR